MSHRKRGLTQTGHPEGNSQLGICLEQSMPKPIPIDVSKIRIDLDISR